MKILITGGAGFVGSHVAEYYARKDYEVVAFDNLSRAELLGYEASTRCITGIISSDIKTSNW